MSVSIIGLTAIPSSFSYNPPLLTSYTTNTTSFGLPTSGGGQILVSGLNLFPMVNTTPAPVTVGSRFALLSLLRLFMS
jgi:hypothetical protein